MSTMTYDLRPADLRGELRLTRRGRIVVFLAALLIAVAVGLLLSVGSAATETPVEPAPTEVVTVAPGETLWGISSELVAGTDTSVREMMGEIERLNALASPVLQAGQRLRIPA